MKIKAIRLNNYKKFSATPGGISFDFYDEELGKINEITLITGHNGSGKSSLLQAIASVVGAAVLDNFRPSQLDWPGFNYRYIQTGRFPVKIETDLAFEEEEVASVRQFTQDLKEKYPDRNYLMPPEQKQVTIFLDYDNDRVLATTKSGKDAFFLTKGFQYAKILESFDKSNGKRFDQIGQVLWYDEQRTYSSIKTEGELALKEIKELIARWYYTHLDVQNNRFSLREGQFDKYKKLKELYEKIFLGRTLRGATLSKGGGNDVDIVFNDGRNDYDFSELSAGERAVFPVLLDFANKRINNSIILIDELELHLHPPLQQQFLNALPHLGHNNQFIITSHSPIIAAQFPDYKKIVIES